ncbi:MAG: DUF4115 domain-containing protein [Pseudohongiellaceae bacterium]|nr:DUF4115 domain-containing protein [Pseudohongiellaceae bacterium]
MTTEIESEEIQESEAPCASGPGELLAKKREELGYTIQQIADRLHITMHYVRALEANEYDKLPGDIFAKGYIRTYASIVKLDPDVLINVYNDYTSQQKCSEFKAQGGSRRRRDRNKPWFIVSAIALVTIAVALWYFSRESSEAVSAGNAESPVQQVVEPAEQQGTPQAPQVTVSTPQVTQELASRLDAVSDNVPEVVRDAAEDLEAMAEELEASVDEESMTESAQSALDASIEGVADELEEEAVSVAPAQQQDQETSVGQLIQVDAGGDDVLKISFVGESIVQIDDSSDTQIYRDIRVAGDVLEVTGSAPFNILLGDAASTSLTFNGSAIDFRTSIRVDNSARLTIGL